MPVPIAAIQLYSLQFLSSRNFIFPFEFLIGFFVNMAVNAEMIKFSLMW